MFVDRRGVRTANEMCATVMEDFVSSQKYRTWVGNHGLRARAFTRVQ